MSLRHRPQLDGLRAAAFLAVAAAHWLPQVASLAFPLGWMAVQVFFALSGFLITSLLLNARDRPLHHALKTFFVRRALRIFPLYFAVLAVGLAVGAPRFVDNAPWLLTYTFNLHQFAEQHWQGAVSHLWTLSVEEQFYLAWPWLILLTPARWLRPALVAVVLAAPLFRATVYAVWPHLEIVGLLTPACLDSLGLGALLAWTTRHAPDRTPVLLRTAGIAGLLLFAGCTAAEWAGAPKALGRLAVTGSAGIALWLVGRAADGFDGPVGRWLSAPWMRFLGKISYGLYVFHNLAPVLTRQLVGEHAPLWQALPLDAALTLALAWGAWLAFEGPINRRKHHFPYDAPLHVDAASDGEATRDRG